MSLLAVKLHIIYLWQAYYNGDAKGELSFSETGFPLVLCGMIPSKVLLLYLSLAVCETVTGMTFTRITLAERNSAQMTVSAQGLKHLCISKIHIDIVHMWVERFIRVKTHSSGKILFC